MLELRDTNEYAQATGGVFQDLFYLGDYVNTLATASFQFEIFDGDNPNAIYSALFLVLNFVTVAINFLILAFVIFLMIKQVNRLRRMNAETPAQAAEPAPPPEDVMLLREIRDSLKTRGGTGRTL